MGSNKKKTVKQKDFVKKKLKVGKTASKPDNYTDTSFKAKTISLPGQSITKKGSSKDEHEFIRHLSLTKHHSPATRKEVLSNLEAHLPSNPALYKQVISSITPLILDQSIDVRKQVASLLSACAERQQGLLDLHIRPIILYVHSAMTHIQPDVRNSSTKFLSILIKHAPEALKKGYFNRTMKLYFTLMSWTLVETKRSVSLAVTTSAVVGGATKRARIHHIAVLKELLQISLFEDNTSIDDLYQEFIQVHPQSYKYMIPSVPQPYAQLKLFSRNTNQSSLIDTLADTDSLQSRGDMFSIANLESISTDDVDSRKKVVRDIFITPLTKSLQDLVKEGGEVARESKMCLEILEKVKEEV